MSGHGFKLYKSYSFVDKDPVIDIVRTIIEDADMSYDEVSGESDVSTTTLRGWFDGKTKRPQYATVAAVLGGLGFVLKVHKQGEDTKVVPIHSRGRKRA